MPSADDRSLPEHLTLAWDEGCDWPLWREDGQDSSDPAYVHGVLGLSSSLVRDLRAWATRAEFLLGSSSTPGAASRPWKSADTLDEVAKNLVQRLYNELPLDIPVRYGR